MAIQCKYCGTNLPKEDARFCNNCGMLVPSHPFSHQSLSALKNNAKVPLVPASGEPQERSRRVLHEQVAELSPARSRTERSEQDEPSNKPEVHEQKPVASENLQSNPLPQQVTAVVEDMPQEKLPDTPQPGIETDASSKVKEEVSEQLSSSLVSSRQAGVKRKMRGPVRAPVWPAPVTHVSLKETSIPEKKSAEQTEVPSVSTASNDEAASAHEMRGPVDVEEIAIEDEPTRALAVPIEDEPTQSVSMAVEDLPTRSMPIPVENQSRVQEQPVDNVPSNIPETQSAAQERFVEDWRVRSKPAASANPSLSTAFEPYAVPAPSSAADQPGSVSDSSSRAENAILTPPVRRPRWPIIVVVLLMVVVLGGLGGLGAVMLLSQQSSNDPVVQAQVSFRDAQLGISLLYPNGWLKQVDAGKSAAHFYASNHIGQVDIMVTTSSGTVKQALQQQATKLGMSGTKAGAALTFAGANWQQLQGTMQQSGANYTDTIVATLHGSQIYIIVQQAPQNNYADWEKEFFVPLRDSFKFL